MNVQETILNCLAQKLALVEGFGFEEPPGASGGARGAARGSRVYHPVHVRLGLSRFLGRAN